MNLKKNIVLAHDVGTSSVKSALIDSDGNIINQATHSYPFYLPQPGWAEQEPLDYWNAVVTNTKELTASINKEQILGMVFTTQAMGIIPVDKKGNVLHKNISWVDGRAEEQAKWMMNMFGGRATFKSFLGIEITGKDVIPKLRWLKQNEPELYKNTYKFLDVNGYLRYKATGKMAAEWSGACSYGFNLRKKDWEHLLFIASNIDRTKLPDLIRSVDIAGKLTKNAAAELNLPLDTPVFGGCDDTQSAAVGSGSTGDGEAHAYIGTSAWAGVTTARAPKFKNGAVCLQSAAPNQNLVIGITESAGNNLEWLINQFYKSELDAVGKENIYSILDEEAKKVPAGSNHLIITPWFLGERCPVSTTTTRSTVFNLSLEHTRGHFVKALSEGIGYNLRWIFENYEKDFKFKIQKIRFIGGGSQNDQWMQTIADITALSVITTNQPNMAGAIGAAMCVFVGSGLFSDFNEVNKIVKPEKTFIPKQENKAIYDELFKTYKDIYTSLKATYFRANSKRFS
ncbi:MAG TPA: FGGY-family carbohydrate kinase [Draconibacterium sp.]|nr:FGGY-family carbohydrate kinase [Draconibacterium sp.]